MLVRRKSLVALLSSLKHDFVEMEIEAEAGGEAIKRM
jgi:hypothetical protein